MRRIGPGVEALKFQEVIRRSLLSAKLRESGGIAAKTLARATIIPPASTGHYIHRTLFVIPISSLPLRPKGRVQSELRVVLYQKRSQSQ